ncbi:fatty acid desaturase [Sulfobacillus thermosulfidooxidans]|uniref:fatty acid desaturase n=1 Tax=Sulfobacillus thermosulfidooxidans TaxID=28034 RepID=UPI0006B50171|nr:fatty acid desaturase [Sulfobacillus thermosulfidooxidans]
MAFPQTSSPSTKIQLFGPFHKVFRYTDGIVPNVAALIYIFAGYFGGWLFLFSRHVGLFILGILLLAHSMIISAYFFHELVHHTIFRSQSTNARMMAIISWINGGCLSYLPRAEKKHLAHHFQKADVISFDFRAWLQKHLWLAKMVMLLEWAYFPAVEMLMRAVMVIQPFTQRLPHRYRVLTTLIIRGGLWFGVLWWYWPAAFGYVLATLLFITVLRFIDAFQHTYEPIVAAPGTPPPDIPARSKTYEEENTYTNLLSQKWPVLNLLVLNFVYHNVHHAMPSMPWHRLRQYHDHQYMKETKPSQILSFRQQVIWYHRYRVARTVTSDYGNLETGFVGAVGVSFLTVL